MPDMFLMERKRSLNKDTVVMKILVLLWQDVKIITNLLLTRGTVTPAALISSPILRLSVPVQYDEHQSKLVL